jgi:hypothetical protein
MSILQSIRPRSGRHSKWWTRFLRTVHHDISYEIETEFTGTTSLLELKVWASSRFGYRQEVHGKIVYVERLIGIIRRDCLNHVIVINAKHLRRILKGYFRYYHEARTHLALDKDAPVSRPIQLNGGERIVAIPQVGGLHHQYERRVA